MSGSAASPSERLAARSQALADLTRFGGAAGFRLPPRAGARPTDTPTEVSLLEALAGCAVDDPARVCAALADWRDWPDLLGQRWWAGAAAFLSARTRALGVAHAVPQALRPMLAAEEYLCRNVHVHAHAHLPPLLARLEHAGLRPVLLKGLVYAHWLYPEPATRAMGDVDILLPPDALPQAQELLTRLGFRSAPMPAAHDPAAHRHLPPMTRRLDGLPLVVELHGALVPRNTTRQLDAAALVARAGPIELGALRARALTADDRLAHLALHHPGELSARRALDVALAARRLGGAAFARARHLLDAEDRWMLDLLGGVAADLTRKRDVLWAVPPLRSALIAATCAPGWGLSHLLSECRQHSGEGVGGLVQHPARAAADRLGQILLATLPVLLREPRRRLTAAARLAWLWLERRDVRRGP